MSAGTLVALLEGGAAPAVTNGNGQAKAAPPAAVAPPAPAPQKAAAARPPPTQHPPLQRRRAATSTGALAHASPGVRRFARELGVPLAEVTGSGPKGRILKEDVQSFVKQALSTGGASARGGGLADLGLPPWPKVDFAKFGPIETLARTRIQKISAPGLARNWVMIRTSRSSTKRTSPSSRPSARASTREPQGRGQCCRRSPS